jgi:hypothetical protein
LNIKPKQSTTRRYAKTRSQRGKQNPSSGHKHSKLAKAEPTRSRRTRSETLRRSSITNLITVSVLEVLERIRVITNSEIRNPEGDKPVKHWKNSALDPKAGKASTTASVPGKPRP